MHTAGGRKGYNLIPTLLLVESKGIHTHVYIVDNRKEYTLKSIPAGMVVGRDNTIHPYVHTDDTISCLHC